MNIRMIIKVSKYAISIDLDNTYLKITYGAKTFLLNDKFRPTKISRTLEIMMMKMMKQNERKGFIWMERDN